MCMYEALRANRMHGRLRILFFDVFSILERFIFIVGDQSTALLTSWDQVCVLVSVLGSSIAYAMQGGQNFCVYI